MKVLPWPGVLSAETLSAVGADICANQTQAEAEPALGAAAVAAIEPVPDARQILRRDADPGVAHDDRGLLVRPAVRA